METRGSVVVVGAGLMGVGIGLVFAAAGHDVVLGDVDPYCREQVRPRLQAALETMMREGLSSPAHAEAAGQRVQVAEDARAACAAAPSPLRLVVEAVSEDLALKRRLLAQLEQWAAPDTLLATNTSGLSITAIAAHMEEPSRLCGTHFWNPPHLIPLVEVVYGQATADRVVQGCVTLLEAAGKRPVVVRSDVPGFVGNRLLHALQREAMALVAAGVASAEDVDLVVTQGFGRRLGVVGPLAVCDLAGLDLVLEVDTYLLPDLERSPEPSPLLRELVQQGHLGVKTGRGFLAWPEEATRETIARRDAALVRALREEHPTG